jgi:hypothetical protein
LTSTIKPFFLFNVALMVVQTKMHLPKLALEPTRENTPILQRARIIKISKSIGYRVKLWPSPMMADIKLVKNVPKQISTKQKQETDTVS